MKAITENELKTFLKTLEAEYDVHLPIRLADGTRALGRLSEGEPALLGGKIPLKATSLFFPQWEQIFSAVGFDVQMSPSPEKPLLVIGFTKQDLDCLEFIDQFFSKNFLDDIYFKKRASAVVVGISGKAGKDGEFLRISGGKCDVELIYDAERFIFAPFTEVGKTLETKISGGVQSDAYEGLKKKSDELPDPDLELITKASELLMNGKVPDEFWESISKRCIACCSCNFSCPTCTCFDVWDRKYTDKIERVRTWDSCQLDGFMREASHHNPMGTEELRTRRRIHHKLAADVDRWDTKTCFLCGRCDDTCPTGIGIKSVCREMVAAYS